MENSVLSQRWPWILALTVVVVGWGVYLSSVYDIEIGDQDDRPIGTAEDIERLAERDDVNVLFIIIDTLRSDRMGSYGYERETSPTFDRLAERGVRYVDGAEATRHVCEARVDGEVLRRNQIGHHAALTSHLVDDPIAAHEHGVVANRRH